MTVPLLCHAALPKSTHALIQAEHFSPVQMQSVKVVTAAGFLHRSLLPPPTCPLLRHQSFIAIVTFFIVKCIQFRLLCQAGDQVGQLLLFRGE